MAYTFDSDENKAASNIVKHGVTFDEAEGVFYDALNITIPDAAHSDEEDRFALLGMSETGKLLVVIYTERGEKIRLISARRASPRERKQYEQEDF